MHNKTWTNQLLATTNTWLIAMQIQNILRLCRRRIYQNKRYNHVRAADGASNNENVGKSDKRRDFKSLLSENQHKITFNSYLEHEKLELGYFR